MRDLPPPLTWVEISTGALQHNVGLLRAAAAEGRSSGPLTCVMVKGNAYGHGLVLAARAFLAAGVDWLGVADVIEARDLRAAGVTAPLYAVCHVPPAQCAFAVAHDLRLTVYDAAVVDAAAAAARAQGRVARLHVKLETGTNRQGLRHDDALALCRHILATEGVVLEGLSTHFADIEDTTDHRFAQAQLGRFQAGVTAVRALLAEAGHDPAGLIAHASNTAAVLLWPEVSLDMVRFGIGAYGLWPSKETFLSAQQLGRRLRPLGPQVDRSYLSNSSTSAVVRGLSQTPRRKKRAHLHEQGSSSPQASVSAPQRGDARSEAFSAIHQGSLNTQWTEVPLQPALTWKTVIAQVKTVPAGEWVGYGRTFRAVRTTRLAILPVGYYDGYDRGLSGVAQVLVGGQRAPVVGRVAMNMVAIDVTDSPRAEAGDEVVLLGRQDPGEDQISAGELAGWLGTIHYEVVTRIHERIPRRAVP